MNPPRPRKTFGQESIDRWLSQLLAEVGTDNNDDLVRSLLVTALDMDAADIDRLELKIATQSLVEMLNAWQVFSPYDQAPKVCIFGSARTRSDHPDYLLTEDFARRMAERGWMAITGAGPGIMQAGLEGAGRENSFGVNIWLPFEQQASEVINGDKKLATFRYFFTRKLTFMKETDAFALLPGGFGTLDETFELLTLVQTGKSYPVPIVMLDHAGSSYWEALETFIDTQLLGEGRISEHDSDLYLRTHDPIEAADYVCRFYSCYRSLRFVGRHLLVRTSNSLSDEAIDKLNDEFDDLLAAGRIERAEPTKAEVRDDDNLDLYRLSLQFNDRSFARLVTFIHRINDYGGEPDAPSGRGLIHDVGPQPDLESG